MVSALIYRVWGSDDGVKLLEELGVHTLGSLQVVLLQLGVGGLRQELSVS